MRSDGRRLRKGAAGSSGRWLIVWIVAAWGAALLLPWFGVEGGLQAIASGTAKPEQLASAMRLVIEGHPRLLMLLVPLALATAGQMQGSPRLLIAAGLTGIAWVFFDGFMLSGRGMLGTVLVPPVGADAPRAAPLGWGALVYVSAMGIIASYGWARLGWLKGDAFTIAALLIVSGAIFIFVGYPVLCILVSAFKANGALDLGAFTERLSDNAIWGLGCLSGGTCGVAWNSLLLATTVGVLSTALGLAFALLSVRTRFPFPRLFQLISILPVITPPFVIGLALILLFGRAGLVTAFINDWFSIPRSRWIYGLPGLTIAQLLAFTPISFLVLRGVLQAVGPSLEEASQTLRAGRWRTFRRVTWPLIRPGLANAFLIAFIESLADFGNPIMIGGNFRVLSTSIYFAVVGAAHDEGKAAALGIVLLAFCLGAFILQRLWTGERSYVSVSGKGDGGRPAELPLGLKRLCYAVVLPWMTLTAAIYGIILIGGFVKSLGADNSFTLEHLLTAFAISQSEHGWFLSGSAWNSLITTLQVAALSMIPTAALGILTGYLLDRQSFFGRGAFEFMTMMSFAIPGTVIGVSYILAFNTPPIELTGTAVIMVIAFVFRNMPVGIRAGIANLRQIDRSLDEASLTLGARTPGTLRRVILPLLRPAIVTSMIYAFVRAMTSVSAVIFLVSGEYNLATVYIVGRAEFGEYGLAIVYSAVLIVIITIALLLIQALVGERRIGRRSLATRATPNSADPVGT
jgi:iron(III) transport system permease protein